MHISLLGVGAHKVILDAKWILEGVLSHICQHELICALDNHEVCVHLCHILHVNYHVLKDCGFLLHRAS